MEKVIITVVGKDTVGIIAKICTYLADSHVNVLDISQTIVDGFSPCLGQFRQVRAAEFVEIAGNDLAVFQLGNIQPV